MRQPVFKIVNDDEPVSMDYPCAVSRDTLIDLREQGDLPYLYIDSVRVGQSVAVGGGAACQFTITRIR